LDANAKYPMKYFPEFTVKVFDVNNKSSKESSNEEKLYTKKFSRVAIVKFFMEMYKNFPLTGEIKGFEENIEVSKFGEWVGKNYIDYKFEYENYQRILADFIPKSKIKAKIEFWKQEHHVAGQHNMVTLLQELLDDTKKD
jgi:hypothetical protein